MSDPIEVLHRSKLEKYHKKEELRSTSSLSSESLKKELPVIESKFLNIDSSSISTAFATPESLLLGSSEGAIHIFNYRESEIMTLNPPKKKSSTVVCMDIWEGVQCIVGYSSGVISLFDLKSSKHIKSFSHFSSPVLRLRYSSSSEQVICLTSQVHIIELKKKVLKYMFKPSLIDTGDTIIVTFELLNDTSLGKSLLLILSYTRLLIYNLTDRSSSFEISSIKPEATPYVAWIRAVDKYHMAISYSTTIAVYNLLKEGFNASLCFETIQDVCGMKWLKPNLLATLGRYSDVFIYLFEGRTKQLVQQIRVNMEIKEQNFLRDSKGLPCYTFHNSFSSNGLGKTVVLGKERLCLLSLFIWNSCLDALVAGDKWNEAFSLGCIFLQDNSFSYMDVVPGKIEVKLKLQEILMKYSREARVDSRAKIAVCFEYCVKYFMADLLFAEIFEFFSNEKKENVEIFTLELVSYVTNGVIRSIPSSCLSLVIKVLSSKSQFETLENLILHLDPPALDAKLLAPICDKHNLINGYIYIYTQSSMQSYVNPLKKIFKLMKKTSEGPKKQYFAYNLLWYLQLAFTGTSFPQEVVRPENRDAVVVKLCEWLYKRKHLENILEIDPDTCLKVIGIIFEDKDIFSKLTSAKFAAVYKLIVDKFSYLLNSQEPYTQKFYMFCVSLMKSGKVSFNSREKINIAKYLIKFRNASEHSLFILSLIQSSEPLEEADLIELLKLAENTHHLDIMSYLYKASKDYQEAINCLVHSESKEQQKKVFKLVGDISQELGEAELEDFKDLILKNLKVLSAIDTDLLGKFMSSCFKNDHYLIIEQLSAAPKLQIQYLSDLVKSGSKLEEKLILLNVKLLCQYHPDSLMDFLMRAEDYSFHECLNIAKQYKHSEGISYMYEKLGLIREAILELTKETQNLKYEIIKQLNANSSISGQLLSKLIKSVINGKNVCKRNNPVFQDDEYNENWYLFINKVFEVYTELLAYKAKAPELISELDNCIEEALEDMISKVDFDVLVTNITSHFGDLPFKQFKQSTSLALNRLSYTESIINRVNSLVLKDRSMITDKLIDYYSQGVCSDDFECRRCRKEVDLTMMINSQETVIVYQDGSVYHSSCIRKK